MITKNEIQIEIVAWFSKKNKKVDCSKRLNDQNIDSLEILDLLSYLEMQLNIYFNLRNLDNNAYFSVEKLSKALASNYSIISCTTWYKVITDLDLISFRKWIEFQFERAVLFKIIDNNVLIGIQDNENSDKIFNHIKKVVIDIELYK